MARLSQLLAGKSPPFPRPASRWQGRRAGGDRIYAAALAMLVILLVVMMLGPLESLSGAADRVDALQAERDRRVAEVAELERRRDALQQPEQVELRARRELGMVEPGEIPFVVVTPEPPDVPPAPASQPARAPWYDRLWQAATSLFD